jgi:two-component system, NarL family, sensor kinase
MHSRHRYSRWVKKCCKPVALFLWLWMASFLAKAIEVPAELQDTLSVLQMLKNGQQIVDKKPEEALQLYATAEERSKQLGFKKGEGQAQACLARWYFGNNTDKAIAYARQSLVHYAAAGVMYNDEIADVHLLLAEAFDEQGKQDSSAYYYYLLGDEIDKGTIQNPKLAMDLYTKLAIFWVNLDFGGGENSEYFVNLRRFVSKAKAAAAGIKDSADAISSVYFIQGAYYHALKKFDSARYYYHTYVYHREKAGVLPLPRKISTYVNITDSYLQQQNADSAMQYIKKVEDLANAPQKNNYLAFYLLFSNLQKGRALFLLKQYKEAINLTQYALEQLKTTGSHLRGELVQAHKMIADGYEALGDYKNALYYKNSYITLADSLMRKDKIDMISRLQIRYRLVEKDKVLAEQKLQLSEAESKVKSKNFTLVGIMLLALFTGIGFVLWRRKNMHKQKLQQERIDNLQQKIEIERLNATLDGEEKERTRIARELHDGIGALLTGAKMNFELVRKNTGFAQNEDFNEGIKLLEETASGLRETAQNIMPEVLMQEGLTNALKSFCERLNGKGGTVISFQSLGDETTTENRYNLPVYRIVQELIQNIRKHAEAKQALVQINYHGDGGLDITVEDDGNGMDLAAALAKNGMGLKNVKERVGQLGGRIDINSSTGKGTSVFIELETAKKTTV